MKNYSYNFQNIEKCFFCHAWIEDLYVLGKRLNTSQGKNPSRKKGITTTIVKCKKCGLIFPNPQPIPINLQDHYGISPDAYWSDDYFKIVSNYLDSFILQMNKIQLIKKDAKILDVGAGIGKAMIEFERNGYDVYGIEPSRSFYQFAIDKMNISKEKIKNEAIENSTFEENQFDVITMFAVLEHLYDPARAVEQVLKWLKPGGLLFIEVPSSNWFIGKLINFYYKITFQGYVGNLSPMHSPYHLFEFSKKSFEYHSKINNYEIATYNYYVCETFLPKFFDPILKSYMKATNTGMELAIWLRKK